MSTRGDLRKVVRGAIRRGWRVTPRTRKQRSHIHLEWIDGARIAVASTPSCCRAFKNVVADMNRIERRSYS